MNISIIFIIIITKAIFSCICLSALDLPLSFKLKNGQEIQNAKIIENGEREIKISHNAGIAKIKHDQLPEEVLILLGLEASSEDEIKLPSPLSIEGKKFIEPILISIDPDGLKIRHSMGVAKIRYEHLTEDLRIEYGPFDSELASIFRDQALERDREALKLAREAEAKMREANNRSLSVATDQVDTIKQELLTDPAKVSEGVTVD